MPVAGVLSGPNDQGWSLEVNLVAWNDRATKIDIRSWDEDHKKMSKGITLTEDEAKNLSNPRRQIPQQRTEQISKR